MFVNGVFVLFFGANLVCFALGKSAPYKFSFSEIIAGRSSLSALGLIHILQRGKLVERWHKDFPALRTEEGLPGSELTGIVAFSCERFIEVKCPPPVAENDLEAQDSAMTLHLGKEEPSRISIETEASLNSSSHYRPTPMGPEYRLDEIPLFDRGLSLDEVCDGRQPIGKGWNFGK
jgi:hypothetical protein